MKILTLVILFSLFSFQLAAEVEKTFFSFGPGASLVATTAKNKLSTGSFATQLRVVDRISLPTYVDISENYAFYNLNLIGLPFLAACIFETCKTINSTEEAFFYMTFAIIALESFEYSFVISPKIEMGIYGSLLGITHHSLKNNDAGKGIVTGSAGINIYYSISEKLKLASNFHAKYNYHQRFIGKNLGWQFRQLLTYRWHLQWPWPWKKEK